MAATLGNAKTIIQVAAPLVSALDLGAGEAANGFANTITFTNGTGANQAGQVFADTRTTDNTGEELDLAGTLTNKFGETITFTAIKGIFIQAASANTLDVVVGGAAANAFVNWVGAAAHTIIVRPGGAFGWVDPGATGYAVTAGTGDLLKVAASASGNITYDVVLLGEV